MKWMLGLSGFLHQSQVKSVSLLEDMSLSPNSLEVWLIKGNQISEMKFLDIFQFGSQYTFKISSVIHEMKMGDDSR